MDTKNRCTCNFSTANLLLPPKKRKRDYADVYVDVASKCISDSLFPKGIDWWGVQTIKSAAAGLKPGATPSFWLSDPNEYFYY